MQLKVILSFSLRGSPGVGGRGLGDSPSSAEGPVVGVERAPSSGLGEMMIKSSLDFRTGLPPQLLSMEDLIEVPGSSEEGAPTPATASSSHLPGETPDLAKDQALCFVPQVPPAPAAHVPPAGPEAPSISFLRERIQNVLRSCRRIAPRRTLLDKTYKDLNLENANAEKRLKIAQVLGDISSRSGYFSENKRDQPHNDLVIQLQDWERSRNANIFRGVGIYLCK